MPYLFNGKELDTETNLTYFGARYLDMKTSLWLNTDPLSGYNPIQETEHYIDGQHNGGVFNPMNHNTYGYTYNNPIMLVDPTGKFPILINGRVSNDSERGNSSYWSHNIRETIKRRTGYQYNQFKYVDGDKGMWAPARKTAGFKQGRMDAVSIYAKLKESIKDGQITEQLQVFSHSRGSAFSNGYTRGLTSEIIKMAKKDKIGFAYGEENIVEYSVNMAPHQSNFIHYPDTGTINVNVSPSVS